MRINAQGSAANPPRFLSSLARLLLAEHAVLISMEVNQLTGPLPSELKFLKSLGELW
jgi:hypothetical protein